MKRKIFNILFTLVLVSSLGLTTALTAKPAHASTFTLSVLAFGGGTVTSPGIGDFMYESGTTVTLVATPNSGQTFVNWSGDISTVANPLAATTTIVINGDYIIGATFSTGGGGGTTTTYTITATAGANGSISPPGTITVSSGGSQTYTITANTGYRISDVQVDGSSVGAAASYTFSGVTAGHTITATFIINSFNITATAGANGAISPSGVATLNYGGNQNYIITPATGYHIEGVLVDGSSVGTAASYAFTNITAGHTISATFAINTYTITATAAANGAISPPGATTVNYGSGQTYTITPNTGYHIASVLADGVTAGTVATYAFTNVITSHTIAATFAINTYTITPTQGDHGTISPGTVATINYGGSQAYTIAPKTGYHITDVLVDGASAGPVPSYTFTNITAAHTITASFAINTYVITPTAGVHGAISPFTAVTVNYGDTQIFNIVPDTGYRVDSVTVDGTPVGAVSSYSFTNVTAIHKIDVTFAIGWPFYTAFGLGGLLVFLLGYLIGKRTGAAY